MRYFTIICLLLVPMVVHGQGAVRRVESLADLLRINPIATGTGDKVSYEVMGRTTNTTWGPPRHAAWKSQSALATNNWSIFACRFGGQWVFDDRDATSLDVRWFGLVGDGFTDNTVAFGELLSVIATTANKVTFPAGTFNVGSTLTFTSTYPIRIDTPAGYSTGWNPSNALTEAKIVYTGPPVDTFVDFKPAAGLRYGLNVEGITIDAAGGATNTVRVVNSTRGRLSQVRPRNPRGGSGLILDNCVYFTLDNYSCSANEIPFLFSPSIGLLLTNACNANLIINPTISGTTEWAISIVRGNQGSFQNHILSGGIESNIGGGVHIGIDCSLNAIDGTWFEANQDIERYVVIDAGALNNAMREVKFENRIGKLFIDGSYSEIQNCELGKIEFGSSAGHNKLRNIFVDIGEKPGPAAFTVSQYIEDVVDALAAVRTNMIPDSIAARGEVIDMWRDTEDHPRLRLARDRILMGDGSAYPSVGWIRNGSSLLSSNSIIMSRTGVNDGLFTAYAPDDPFARVSLNIDSTLAFGMGTSPADLSLRRFGAGTWITDGGTLVVRPGASYTLIGGYPTNSAQPTYFSTVGGSMTWGTGGTNPTDVSLYRQEPGYLRVDWGLYIGTTNVLLEINSRATNGHSHDGQYVLSTNGFSTNLTATGTTTLTGTLVATNIGSDLAIAGAHRIIVREATTMGLRPMTPAYLLGLLDVHAANIVDATSLGQNLMKASSLSALMGIIGSGTPNSNVWLRGDAVWSTPPAGGSATNGIPDAPSDDVMYARINHGWSGITPDFIDMPIWCKWFLSSIGFDDALFNLNLTTGGAASIIDSPAVHVTRVNSGGSNSSRHRLNLIGGNGISLSLSDDAVDDEADVTISTSLVDGSVTKVKLEDVTAGRLLGRTSASTGPPQEITPGAGLSMSNTTLIIDPSSFISGQVLYVAAEDVSLGGPSFTQGAWTNILGAAKSGTSKTIAAGALGAGTTIKIELSGTMAFQDDVQSNVVRVAVGGLVFTFPFQEVNSFASQSGVWDMTCMLTVKTPGSTAVTRATGWWNWQTLDAEMPSTLSSYWAFRTKAFVGGTLNTVGTNLISADFYGDNPTGKQFTEFNCNHVIVTRY